MRPAAIFSIIQLSNSRAIILKNNVPRYLVIDFSKAEEITEADDTDVMAISQKLLEANKEAYEVLAK